MKLLDSGEPELDIKTDPFDIKMAELDPNDIGYVFGSGLY